jgi:sugar phosphate permease
VSSSHLTHTRLTFRYVPGSAEEKKLLRKMDLRIVPTIWVLYTLSYLNRANIGNAKTGGLEKEFNMTSTQYSIVLLVFFISYVLFEIPSNLIIARVRPSIYLSSLCVAWGIVAGCAAATQNWSQLAAVRFGMSFFSTHMRDSADILQVLGITEAGFAPGTSLHRLRPYIS